MTKHSDEPLHDMTWQIQEEARRAREAGWAVDASPQAGPDMTEHIQTEAAEEQAADETSGKTHTSGTEAGTHKRHPNTQSTKEVD